MAKRKQTLLTQVSSFIRTQKTAGVTGLVLCKAVIDHTIEHGDWTPMAKLIGDLEGTDSSRVRAIIGACYGGIQLKRDPKQAYGLRVIVGDNSAPTEMYAKLEACIEAGVSFRSKLVAEEVLNKETPDFDQAKYIKTLAAKIVKEDIDMSTFFAEVRKAVAEKNGSTVAPDAPKADAVA